MGIIDSCLGGSRSSAQPTPARAPIPPPKPATATPPKPTPKSTEISIQRPSEIPLKSESISETASDHDYSAIAAPSNIATKEPESTRPASKAPEQGDIIKWKIYDGVKKEVLDANLEIKQKKKKEAEERLANVEVDIKKQDAEAHVLVYLIGDGGVGKTCLATSFYKQGDFDEEYNSTCFAEHDVYLNATLKSKIVRTRITIIDTAGQEDVYSIFKHMAETKVKAFADKASKGGVKSGLVVVMCHQWNKAQTFSNLIHDDEDNDDDGDFQGHLHNVSGVLKAYNKATTGDEDTPGNASIILCATQTDNGDQATSDEKVEEHVKNLHEGDSLSGLLKSNRVGKCNCSAYFDYPSVVDVFTTASEMALIDFFQK